MTTNTNDLRWQRSQEKIKRALVEELQIKSFDHLTVAAIVKRAHMSRRTFYLHYEDKFDLLKHLEDDLVTEIKRAFNHDQEHFKRLLDDRPALWQQNYLLINQTLQVIDQERKLCQVLLSANGDPHFREISWHLVTDEINARIQLYHAHFSSRIPKQYAEELITAGVIGLIQAWLNNPHPESVDHFSQILTDSQLIAPLDLLEKD